MHQEHQNGTDLEQEIKTFKQNIKPMQMRNSSEISQKSHTVRNVVGVVKLASSPHYGLILETGSAEQPFIIPICMVDITKHINQWICVIGKKVWINQLLIVYDRFQNFDECKDLECMNVVVLWEDVKVLEDSLNVQFLEGNNKTPDHEDFTNVHQQQVQEENNKSPSCDSSCRVLVLIVSSAFYVDQPPAFCLVFISYIKTNGVEGKLWLVLQGEHVSWKSFLIPNREYIISMSTDWFDKSQKPLKELFPSPCKELQVIFHHPNFYPNLNGCILPLGAKIFLSYNTQISEYVCRFSKGPFNLWFSVSEADYADADLVTLFGQVNIIKYDYEDVFKHCYLCVQAKPKQTSLTAPNYGVSYSWTNPWVSKSLLEKGQLLALPTAEKDTDLMKKGVPGNLVQIIKLNDVITGEEKSVYLKHSFISQSQQSCRLSAGMTVCITNLNRRCSKKGQYYYITTLLSSFQVLSVPNKSQETECLGVYGLNHTMTPNSLDRMWGVFETNSLIKVTITAKCSNCKNVFYQRKCSEECPQPTAQLSALAIGWVQIINEDNSVSLEKVIIKDSLVRELLCIPQQIWQMLLKASIKQEMVCLMSEQDWSKPDGSPGLNELFKLYCFIPKQNGAFFISVKNVASSTDDDPVYYCIQLKPIEENRLKIVAELANKSVTGVNR